ncbi:MAG: response regulator [Desulfobacterales bacterium]|nr:response regulator [Desulfobacterales bacterium]
MSQPLQQDQLKQAFNQFNQLSDSLAGSFHQLNQTLAGFTHRLDGSLATQEQQAMTQHLRALLDAIPGAVIVINSSGEIVDFNAAATDVLGSVQHGDSWRDIVSREFLPELDQGELRTADGRQYSISTRPLGYQPGQILLLSDVTQTRQLQRAAQQNLHLMTMGKMMASLAHQIRTPLSSSMLYLSQIAEGNLDAEKNKKFTGKALDRIKHIEKMINDMLVFAHGGQFHMSDFAVADVIQELKDLLQPQLKLRQVELVETVKSPEIVINGNKDALLGALSNLCMNAMDAGQAGMRIGVDVKSTQQGDVEITIQDNGCGIPEAYAKDIYSPSFTLKGSRDLVRAYLPDIRGTGYGLSNVKKYIDKHKGSIEFLSQVDKGTRFVISLPVVAKTLLDVEKDEMMKKPVIRRRRILVVEDESAISMVLEKILTSDPFYHTVRLATDGASAIEIIDCEPFDLVSLDYMLPGRINGLDVYTHIRRTNKKLPVVFISGNIRFLESMKTLQASDGYLDHLSKPFENLVYADKINHWLQNE